MPHRSTTLFHSRQFVLLFMTIALIVASLMVSGVSGRFGARTAHAAGFDCNTITDIPVSECNTLVALYDNTSGPTWTKHTNWEITTTACNWYGITCTSSYVTQLFLRSNMLKGSILSLNGLTKLTNLDLSLNQLGGSIPSLSGLTNLQIVYLFSNQLSGSIPSLMGLTSLQAFYLNNNQLSGSIPSVSGLTSLQYLDLEGNQFKWVDPASHRIDEFDRCLSRQQPVKWVDPAFHRIDQPEKRQFVG